jgi:hypothetical protein
VLNLLDVEIDFVQIGDKAAAHDSDFDGCTDNQELGADQTVGGRRDPFNAYDFFDPKPPGGDGTIDLLNDIFGVAFKFGTAAPGPPNPGQADYDAAFDRGGGVPGSGTTWNIQGPDGTIDLLNDIFGVAFQFGHAC